MDQDVIYVGGGSTPNMLAIWRVHGLEHLLREAWEAGVVMCGISAGSLCWFEAGVTDSLGKDLQPFHNGLGLLPGSHCPHYDEPDRRSAYHRFVADGLPGGVAADSGVGLHFVGTELAKVVTTRVEASAYRVELINGEVVETLLPAESL
jgi:dipeptidase E